MKWLFDADGPLLRGLSRIFDMLLISLLTIICSLPVITIGAAMSAMYDISIKIVLDRDNGIIKPYFKSFARNFKKGTLIWLVCLAGIAFVSANYMLLSTDVIDGVPNWMNKAILILVFIVTLIMLFELIYVFPLQARYENKVSITLKNALFISIVQFPRSIGLAFLNVVIVILGVIAPGVIPLLLILEFSVVTYITAYNMVKVFVAMGDQSARRDAPLEDTDEGDEIEEKSE